MNKSRNRCCSLLKALEKMSELTATAFEQRDKQIAELSDRIEAIEQRDKQLENAGETS